MRATQQLKRASIFVLREQGVWSSNLHAQTNKIKGLRNKILPRIIFKGNSGASRGRTHDPG